MHPRHIRLVFVNALLLVAAVSRAQEQPHNKCNATAAECERAIRSMAAGRRYLGAMIKEIEPGAGLRIVSIITDSPAWRGGLGDGDRLMQVNGKSLVRADVKDFKRILSDARETGWLAILVQRNGILKRVDVRLEPYTKTQIDKMVAQHLAEAHSSQSATSQPQP